MLPNEAISINPDAYQLYIPAGHGRFEFLEGGEYCALRILYTKTEVIPGSNIDVEEDKASNPWLSVLDIILTDHRVASAWANVFAEMAERMQALVAKEATSSVQK